MPYNNAMTRSASNPPAMVSDDISALIPEEVTHDIWKGVIYKSAVLQLAKKRTMSRKQLRMPVLSLLPIAYFVSGDTGLKQSTEIDWTNVYVNAEEIAVIVPIPESVADDIDYNIWDEAKPLLQEAIAVTFDDAVLFGTNAPASWPTAIVTAANSAGNQVTAGTSSIDYADDLNEVIKAVEMDGYDPNGMIIRAAFKAKMRGLRATTRELIFQPETTASVERGTFQGTIWSLPAYVSKGGFGALDNSGGASHYEAIVGDWDQVVVGMRQDLTFRMLDQAVIQDNTGAILFNLAQQDMVAMRVVMRVGWAVPNPPNRLQPTAANRYPFGNLRQA